MSLFRGKVIAINGKGVIVVNHGTLFTKIELADNVTGGPIEVGDLVLCDRHPYKSRLDIVCQDSGEARKYSMPTAERIPRFVEEYLYEALDGRHTLFSAMDIVSKGSMLYNWLYTGDTVTENQILFAKRFSELYESRLK